MVLEATAPGDTAYHVESYTDTERRVLERFFTNVDGPVFAIVNLPEVVKGALFARYSRSPKSVRRLFLDEFYQLADAPDTKTGGGSPNGDDAIRLQKADALYERVFTQYGDDSVAQLGGAHLACEQASNILTKILEWGRLASYLEQSTRYIAYDQTLGDRYRYHVPAEIAASPLVDEYAATMDWLFDSYSSLMARMVPYYETLHPKKDGDSNFVWKSTIGAKACDDLRGLLPAATTSNVGIFASGQAFEMMLLRMRAHPLAEARAYADLMLVELRKVIPAFMRRVDVEDRGVAWSRYLSSVAADMDRRASLLGSAPEHRSEVTLVDWDRDAELKVAAAALYAHSNLPDDQILEHVASLSTADQAALVRAYVGERANRRHKPGRGMERVGYRFDILCDYGIFRDLQRHRMLTLEWQRLSPDHGYVVPDAIDEIGGLPVWHEAMERTAALFEKVGSRLGPDAAQYVVPFAYRIRFFFQLNAREAFHLLELRTVQGGHPDYRRVCQEMHRLIRDEAGHHVIADAMRYVDHDNYDLARIETERKAAARRVALGIEDPG
ncbi:MAG: FAD-dependent thymidylate synthase [Acidimicrobiia bacterium]